MLSVAFSCFTALTRLSRKHCLEVVRTDDLVWLLILGERHSLTSFCIMFIVGILWMFVISHKDIVVYLSLSSWFINANNVQAFYINLCNVLFWFFLAGLFFQLFFLIFKYICISWRYKLTVKEGSHKADKVNSEEK